MSLIAISMMALGVHSLVADGAQINRLIEQLGSEVFAQREAATKALDQIGEPALGPLQDASSNASDVEIQRRAERLVNAIGPRVSEQRALEIRSSKLSPEAKGRKLKALVKEGMMVEEVHRLLGFFCTGGGTLHSWTAVYPQYGLCVHYDQYDRVSSVSSFQ